MLSHGPWQYIKKCCSSSMQIKHVASSTGIDVPLFSYFPVCIHNELTPSGNFVILSLCAGLIREREWVSECGQTRIECQNVLKLLHFTKTVSTLYGITCSPLDCFLTLPFSTAVSLRKKYTKLSLYWNDDTKLASEEKNRKLLSKCDCHFKTILFLENKVYFSTKTWQ